MRLNDVRELRSLRHEDSKLKQLVADLTLDRHILQEIVRKAVRLRPRCLLADWATVKKKRLSRRADHDGGERAKCFVRV